MVELKIDEELRDLLPSLSLDEKKQLEKNLMQDGYIGSPIYTWNGYIIDGHNRYEICRKNGIEFPVEELQLGKDSTKIDAMEWMINTQLGRRNLIPAQRLLVVDKFKERIRREAAENKSKNGGDKKSELSNWRSPIGEVKKVHTDKELAKIAGVGTGTIGRWNQVQKLADDDLKQKVATGEVKIATAYDIVKGNDSKKNSDVKQTNVIDNIKEDKQQNGVSDDIIQICKDVKSDKDINTYWNFLGDIECVEDNINQAIDSANSLLFEMEDINGKITSEERDIALSCVKTLEEKLNNLYNKIKKVKLKGEM